MQKELIDGAMSFILKQFKITDWTLKLKNEGIKGFHTESILESFIKISDILLNEMSWKLLVNETEIAFWTSDNPCASYNELESELYKGSLGLKCKGFQLHIPLSYKLLLILMNPDVKISDLSKAKSIKNKEFKKGISHISEESDANLVDLLPNKISVRKKEGVEFENELQITSSTQFIFSKDSNFELAHTWLGKHPRYMDKDRKRLKEN